MKKTVWIVLITIIFMVIISAGCLGNENNPNTAKKEDLKEITIPIDYGNGVYYFGCTGKDFANSGFKLKVENKGWFVVY